MEEKQISRDKDRRILDRKSGTITSRMSELCREEPESRGVNTILGQGGWSLGNIDAVGLLLLNTRHALGAFQLTKTRAKFSTVLWNTDGKEYCDLFTSNVRKKETTWKVILMVKREIKEGAPSPLLLHRQRYYPVKTGRYVETHTKDLRRVRHPRTNSSVPCDAHTYARRRPLKFCNMLLFGLSEYLRDLPYPSAIVVTLTDIDNPQEKLAGYLESRIFPGHASALESRFSLLERELKWLS
ncbi:hypothetical protein V1477_004971, partial [Vespula maculifrons]